MLDDKIKSKILGLAKATREASYEIAKASTEEKNNILKLQSSNYLNKLINLFQNDQSSWIELMNFIEEDMPNWGKGNKYMRLYFDCLGLKPNKSAFLNIMLCSAKRKNSRGELKNYYSQRTMQNCFNLHTKQLLESLERRQTTTETEATDDSNSSRYYNTRLTRNPSSRVNYNER